MDQISFEQHPIWSTADRLAASLNEAANRADPDSVDLLQQLTYVLSAVRSHAHPTDTSPYARVSLDTVNNQLAAVEQEVRNYVSNGNRAHLGNADGHADGALHHLGSLPVGALRGGAARQATQTFNEYRDLADQTIAELTKQSQDLQQRIAKQQAVIDQHVRDVHAQLDAYRAQISSDETRLDEALTRNNEVFTAKQTEREDRFREALDNQASRLEEIVAGRLQHIQELETDADEAFAAIDQLRHDTEKVSGLAAADILAGKFAEHSKQRWAWGIGASIVGLAALITGVVFLILALRSIGADDSISWQYAVLKIGATVTIVGASAVAFRLGGQFLSESSANKRMELELRAIGPFFADVQDPAVLQGVKQAFVERAFAAGTGGDGAADQSALSGQDVAALLRDALDVVKTVGARGA